MNGRKKSGSDVVRHQRFDPATDFLDRVKEPVFGPFRIGPLDSLKLGVGCNFAGRAQSIENVVFSHVGSPERTRSVK